MAGCGSSDEAQHDVLQRAMMRLVKQAGCCDVDMASGGSRQEQYAWGCERMLNRQVDGV